ncbi:acidic leucine-rich nuclear phosphoprotein 32 family member A isoform X2 [Drosophila mojavensis]|uniref:Uncharacterized protein, isoform A n=1 Tax=Drosophila mojavensis TaxID=7230 RepID=B4KNJ6_DROMO|nr:acidic leucine-rich nuclear phosphoprotein 32 family member A isoform X2 [Drosophila mojavensis]EDW08955.1 uncharacterized protein Dmoj_GI19290, isoform A [Drosophila mojavensis]
MEKRIELERRARKANQILELNLDNCRSTSIVGLTDEYTALETLSLINVGLTTLKGFPKLPNLKKLELSDNRISSGLHYLTTSPKLQYLNLSGNKIKDLETLKPLKEFKNLNILDLFNNDATQVENYREKIFKMLPSLNFLDGFDCNDEEVQSEGDDDDEVNGNDSEDEDEPSAFCVNGLEIDLDELDALEQRVKAKKRLQEMQIQKQKPPDAENDEVDELDEYLKELQIKEKAKLESQSVIEASHLTVQPNNNQSNTNFAILIYWFLAILNLANAAYFSGGDDDEEDSDESEDGENGDVSLSEVYNDDLEEDNSDWEEGEGGDEDEDEDSDIDEADGDPNESAASVNNAKDEKDAEKPDETHARGKKRKHDG